MLYASLCRTPVFGILAQKLCDIYSSIGCALSSFRSPLGPPFDFLFDTCSCQTAKCFNKSKGVLITGSKLKAFRNPQPSWGFSVHKKNLRICAGWCNSCAQPEVDFTYQYLWDHHFSNLKPNATSGQSQQRFAKCNQRFAISFFVLLICVWLTFPR
ncbi:Hypothetical protein c3433 [Escherichia coli CFT073]|uniref:Uncharacterized protein n=1 Tax=Escherichia coli O6:H1 (strain CFT073 / ATCC 700928 / UPEC) TaxID=199310 RepID=A0A0H2VA90_ECOL6|nr:Hypothetical protein c3433 [Escherichia coli CFT073]